MARSCPRSAAADPMQGGFSLVEVMVATLVMGLAVFSVVSMIRNGGVAEKRSDLRRQAARILQSTLEGPEYHFSRFVLPPPLPDPACVLDADQALTIPCEKEIEVEGRSIVLDNLANPINYRYMTGKIRWMAEGRRDSVILTRSMSEVFWRSPP